MPTTEEKINQMYDAQFKSQKERLDTDYANANSDLDAQKAQNQKATDTNLNRTAVESQKAAMNNAELHNAYGLSSGARAQARLSQENQLQADMTAIRTAQQDADAEVERQRSILAREYASAIRQAQAENDFARAQALYQSAKEAEARLLSQREAAARLMAEAGDYTRLGALYGLSAEEIALLMGSSDSAGAGVGVGSAAGAVTGAIAGSSMLDRINKGNSAGGEVDMQSLSALGYGPISPERAYELMQQGLIETYTVNGKTYFRKTARPTWSPLYSRNGSAG